MPPRERNQNAAGAQPEIDIDILDVADGIERIMGNRDLYARMLVRFRSAYRDRVAPMAAALAIGERATLHRHVHTLKGSSGMIGARRLHQCACALEVAIRTQSDDETRGLAALASEFDLVLQAIERLLASGSIVALTAAPLPRTLLPDTALLARLIELLLVGDGAAVDVLEESGASLKVILGETRLMQVATAVNAFDFDGALLALRQTSEMP